MEVRILGPLEVRAMGRPLPLGGTKQRTVLAMLVLHANQVVAIDHLIDGLWGPLTEAQDVRVPVLAGNEPS
jgi:DNA-binding SARP family transcriptional activator